MLTVYILRLKVKCWIAGRQSAIEHDALATVHAGTRQGHPQARQELEPMRPQQPRAGRAQEGRPHRPDAHSGAPPLLSVTAPPDALTLQWAAAL